VEPQQRTLEEVIGDCAVYEDGQRRPGRVPLEEAGELARATDGFVWIGLQQPSAAEIAAVAEEFALPPLAVEDAVQAHQRPKLEVYGDDMIFVVLKPVVYVDHEEVVQVSELALFVGKGFVVSVRHGQTPMLRQVRAELDTPGSPLLQHGPVGVLYRTADLVVDGYEAALEAIDDDVDEIEIQVFGGDALDHSQRIYKLKREIADFRRAVVPLGTPLERLAVGSVRGVPASTKPYFRDVHDHLLRAAEAIERHDRLLSDVLQADLSRAAVRQTEVAVRQNEDMRKISAWAAIALVPTAIAGIYGMNFDDMPELRWRFGYPLVVLVILTVCLGLHRQFRRNGWL
jgi:magnesium transporter